MTFVVLAREGSLPREHREKLKFKCSGARRALGEQTADHSPSPSMTGSRTWCVKTQTRSAPKHRP